MNGKNITRERFTDFTTPSTREFFATHAASHGIMEVIELTEHTVDGTRTWYHVVDDGEILAVIHDGSFLDAIVDAIVAKING